MSNLRRDLEASLADPVDPFTPGPWDYVPSTEHHGPYVTSNHGGTICDCYVMSHPAEASTANGGRSKPIPFFHEMADPNARLIASAPNLHMHLRQAVLELGEAANLLRQHYPRTATLLDKAVAEHRDALAEAGGAS